MPVRRKKKLSPKRLKHLKAATAHYKKAFESERRYNRAENRGDMRVRNRAYDLGAYHWEMSEAHSAFAAGQTAEGNRHRERARRIKRNGAGGRAGDREDWA